MSRRRHDCGIAECAALPISGQGWALGQIPGAGHAYRERKRAFWWVYYSSWAGGRARIRFRRVLRAWRWLEHAENRLRRLQAIARTMILCTCGHPTPYSEPGTRPTVPLDHRCAGCGAHIELVVAEVEADAAWSAVHAARSEFR